MMNAGVLMSWLLASLAITAEAGPLPQTEPFRQLEEVLPTPTETRTASGAPGSQYWQQEVDYDIKVELDDENQRIIGSERIYYKNNSPHTLNYLWVQLDPNYFAPDSPGRATATIQPHLDRVPYRMLRSEFARETFDGSVKLTKVASGRKSLNYVVVQTMMRVDLPDPLEPGDSMKLDIDWSYAINNAKVIGGRTGYEYFEEDGNYIYEIAQWYPRMAAYNDVTGWQHLQYYGRGEFTLEFGDYDVEITVPEDHVVAATGELKNSFWILDSKQRSRLREAKKAKKPIFIVTPEEAKKNEKSKKRGKKTWKFRAENVRDFAFASSRKFIWDAKLHRVGKQDVWAMSFYPNEGEPLWSRYSTHAIIHTLNVYSRYAFDYPYPTAISVNGPVGGMEYPMICFNGPRPEKDGTYSARTKYGLISVIIHEVGHFFFPMIVNSDERQWTWMDEGVNTFVQFIAEQEWEENYPSRRGDARNIVDYMASKNQVPIMTNSESILQFGANAYAKPATALNILRETIMGRELFDFAFKTYAQRWKFKRPMPADLFRTLEDASGMDLDWFWRGWFYSTDHTDIAITDVREFRVDTKNPDIEKREARKKRSKVPESISSQRNKGQPLRVEEFEELKDFYNTYDPLAVIPQERKRYQEMIAELSDDERRLLRTQKRFYVVTFENIGGLVMPLIVQLKYKDGSQEIRRVPAQIWRRSPKKVSRMFVTDKEVESLVLDPYLETADTNLENNFYPPKIISSRFEVFQRAKRPPNPMQQAGLGTPPPPAGAKAGAKSESKAQGQAKKAGIKAQKTTRTQPSKARPRAGAAVPSGAKPASKPAGKTRARPGQGRPAGQNPRGGTR